MLIYIFRERSSEKAVPDAAAMRPEHLLVSPIMTNQLPWSRGYFETLANIPWQPTVSSLSTASSARPEAATSTIAARSFPDRSSP